MILDPSGTSRTTSTRLGHCACRRAQQQVAGVSGSMSNDVAMVRPEQHVYLRAQC